MDRSHTFVHFQSRRHFWNAKFVRYRRKIDQKLEARAFLLHLTREGKLKTTEHLYEHSGCVVITYGLGAFFNSEASNDFRGVSRAWLHSIVQ
jgi:hypothetical protein